MKISSETRFAVCSAMIKRILLLLGLVGLTWSQEPKVFELKTGEKISGTVMGTDEITGKIMVQTPYGLITLDPENLVVETVTVTMKFGDVIQGQLLLQDQSHLVVKSSLGVLSVNRTDIERIDYQTDAPKTPIALTRSSNSNKFSAASERQIDVFYDPTGYTLSQGTLYISGLSWGFGATEKLQITSRFVDYFWGNFNARSKFQLFKTGNVDRETALAVGFEMNSRWWPNRYKWDEQTFTAYERTGYDSLTGATRPVYYGQYNLVGSEISLTDSVFYGAGSNELWNNWVDVKDPEWKPYYEAFAAYTVSKARSNMQGRISHTIGASVGKAIVSPDLMYRVYYAAGVDIRENLIFNFEAFYDPSYVELWNRGILNDGDLFFEKPAMSGSPLHFDIGFIYAYSDFLRFGIHFQPYIVAIYMKF